MPFDAACNCWHGGSAMPDSRAAQAKRTEDYFRLLSDEDFDSVFPESVQRQSNGHWTPAAVCRKAAEMLNIGEGTRVLDIGCGPGKFCAIGAATSSGTFTGIEQRESLVWAAREMIAEYGIPRVNIIHGNVVDLQFSDYDAFYIFNPFQENVMRSLRIDTLVDLDSDLYQRYSTFVRDQLSSKTIGTHVVTFWGDWREIPDTYVCEKSAFGGKLRLWVKRS